ncbi:MAG: GNAT family N-acetyltransferase [Oscillospiraceae bacterium]|nr:GNAT family N-acetyltransferase [Oscillospiraceae bacterium]
MSELDSLITTERLFLRRLTQDDFADLCEMLQDADVMYAWERTFSELQVQEWLDCQLERYEKTGVGFWAAIEQKTGEMVGQIGLAWADIESKRVLELDYMLKKAHWHKGFAVEGGRACLDYAFNEMGVDKAYASIRPENQSSRKVAEKLCFQVQGEYVKHYNGKDMLHLIYACGSKS